VVIRVQSKTNIPQSRQIKNAAYVKINSMRRKNEARFVAEFVRIPMRLAPPKPDDRLVGTIRGERRSRASTQFCSFSRCEPPFRLPSIPVKLSRHEPTDSRRATRHSAVKQGGSDITGHSKGVIIGAIVEAIVAYAQPLIEQTDGSPEQMQKAFSIAQLCYNPRTLTVRHSRTFAPRNATRFRNER
jgi:hypothetical protein